MSKPLFALVGPTASGKSEIAALLAVKFPLEIISCDSMQVYKGMPILTQVPKTTNPKTHLVSFLSPGREYNAALFRTQAQRLLPDILKRKKIPCLVGGTGLYLRALLDGIFEDETDSKDEAFRAKMLKLHGYDVRSEIAQAFEGVLQNLR